MRDLQGHKCPECGADLGEVDSCQENFYQFLGWESEDMSTLGRVHHLMVLCYHLQHPSLYSPEGMSFGIQLLVDFVEGSQTPESIRQNNQARLDSTKRTWKIAGSPAARGSYPFPVGWQLTTTDVLAGGRENYVESVQAWAQATLEDLRSSGNIAN